jgi:hypothetical protein
MTVKDYLRPITQRAIGLAPSAKRKYVTIHTSIHIDIHDYLKRDAATNNVSLAKMLEIIIADYYKDKLKTRETVTAELGDPDFE